MLQLIAQLTNPSIDLPGGIDGGTATNEAARSGALLASYIALFWRTLIILGGLATILFLLWGAIDWITAGGEQGKIESARKKMTGAIIGLAILAASVAIVELVGNLIGLDLLELTFPTPDTFN